MITTQDGDPAKDGYHQMGYSAGTKSVISLEIYRKNPNLT